ncbi:MAG TPA: hypothetical protein VHO70_13190 [Chitinispirillaceae bacterium]|nr:hypothetical protein [Chitinispirillaceae bacterium]
MSDFIDGIHNYCDRWCERCELTSRCSSYAIEKKLEDIKKSGQSINKNAFWEIFDSLFEGIFREQGYINCDCSNETDALLEADPISFDVESCESEPWKTVEENEVVEAARYYATDITEWIRNYEDDIVNSMSTSDSTGKDTIETVTNSIEVVMWYSFFIAAKLHRALHKNNDDFIELPVDSDENGSAKIALIAINRSIAAWSIIRSAYKTDHNTTAGFMGRLIAIRRVVEQTFPRANEFVRPGFDNDTLGLAR